MRMETWIISADYIPLYEIEYIPMGKSNPWDAVPIDMAQYHVGFLHVEYMEGKEAGETIIPLDEFAGYTQELRELYKTRGVDREGWYILVLHILKEAQEMGVCHPGPLHEFMTVLEERTIDMWEERQRERKEERDADEEEQKGGY